MYGISETMIFFAGAEALAEYDVRCVLSMLFII
nr:MAG TPA: hypothetical protein [Caudoviricetes sp.]